MTTENKKIEELKKSTNNEELKKAIEQKQIVIRDKKIIEK